MTIERIIKVLKEFRDFDAGKIGAETTFKELGLDSLDVVDLVMKIEEEFGVSIPMSGEIQTIGDVAGIIDKSNG